MSDLPASPLATGASPLHPGARVQEYQIQRTLGDGGFGLTYLAHDTHLDLPVALKEFFPAETARRLANGQVAPWIDDCHAHDAFQAGLSRFLDEARTLASFRHAHIVRVLRYFQANGTGYIVMEYEAGLPLRHWVARQPPLACEALLGIVLPLLDGLEAVHAAGFLHRDIQPDNILVRPGGSPVLLDFGAAGRVNDAPALRPAIVSPGFAAPEQYDCAHSQGPWTDVYAIGAVMYWMATGAKPAEATARQPVDPMPPATLRANAGAFGRPLLRVIDQALRPRSQQRLQSVAELRAALVAASVPSCATLSLASIEGVPPGVAQADLLCSVLFMDLVSHSLRSVGEQVALKAQLDDLVACVLEGLPAERRLAIDTGDGAALCFLGDPHDALAAAMRLREALDAAHRPPALQVRCGLHIGPVRVVHDINRRVNVIGDGINMARRVMDFAQPNQVLASCAFRDVIARSGNDHPGLFCYVGPHMDKHGRVHELHVLDDGGARPAPGSGRVSEPSAIWYATANGPAALTERLLRLDTGARQAPGSAPVRYRDAATVARRRTHAPALAQALVSPSPPARLRS